MVIWDKEKEPDLHNLEEEFFRQEQMHSHAGGSSSAIQLWNAETYVPGISNLSCCSSRPACVISIYLWSLAQFLCPFRGYAVCANHLTIYVLNLPPPPALCFMDCDFTMWNSVWELPWIISASLLPLLTSRFIFLTPLPVTRNCLKRICNLRL